MQVRKELPLYVGVGCGWRESVCVCGIEDIYIYIYVCVCAHTLHTYSNKKWNINVKCVSSVNESNWEGSN